MAPEHLRMGALPGGGGVRFCLWAPIGRRVEVVREPDGAVWLMTALGGGYHALFLPEGRPGMLYRYRLDGQVAYPDPASRFQPQGIHGPSMVVDPNRYTWHDAAWQGPARKDLVFYEVHVGTFTSLGTFAGVREQLPYLKRLGITAVELMPVAEFPGRWNWGYDSAALFAPSRAYGTPDDLRALVDHAHELGLAIILDVVYNHFGPDGAYAPALSPFFLSQTHRTPWGPAVNFDGPGSEGVRRFFIENALHWFVEYHLDGLRLDATHAIIDDSPRHFLRELAAAVEGLGGRKRYLIAEDHRNLDRLVRPFDEDGYGLEAVWSDDYHHLMRRILTADREGYFGDFTDSTRDLATVVRKGWLFVGQHAPYFGGRRGTDPTGIPLERFVHFLQNHDQVGNRARGDRLTETVPPAAIRAATTMLLLAPELPLLFMGQECGACTPFCFFTDHNRELGVLVTEGRKREFARFPSFGSRIPDPQDRATFEKSRLDWSEPDREPHAGLLRLHQDLLARRPHLSGDCTVESPVEGGLLLRRGVDLLLVALRDGLELPLAPGAVVTWHTEDPRYVRDSIPPQVSRNRVAFPRAGAALARLVAR